MAGTPADWWSRSTRDAVGAVVYLTSGKLRQRADILSGGSFASSNDPRVHFGLGNATLIDQIEIEWLCDLRQTIKPKSIDRIIMVEEGKGIIVE